MQNLTGVCAIYKTWLFFVQYAKLDWCMCSMQNLTGVCAIGKTWLFFVQYAKLDWCLCNMLNLPVTLTGMVDPPVAE